MKKILIAILLCLALAGNAWAERWVYLDEKELKIIVQNAPAWPRGEFKMLITETFEGKSEEYTINLRAEEAQELLLYGQLRKVCGKELIIFINKDYIKTESYDNKTNLNNSN